MHAATNAKTSVVLEMKLTKNIVVALVSLSWRVSITLGSIGRPRGALKVRALRK